MERAVPKASSTRSIHHCLLTEVTAFRVPLEHAEEQSSRARTGDGRWKASRFVRTFVPFAGRETSGGSSADSSRGSALQTPSHAIGDQEMLETASSWGSPLHSLTEESLDSGLSARAGDGSRSQERGKSSTARLALSHSSAPRKGGRRTRTGATANLPVVLPGGEIHLVPAAIRRRGTDRAPARPRRRKRGTNLS